MAAARMGIGLVVLVGYLAISGKLALVAGLSQVQWGWALLTGLILAAYVATWFGALRRAPAVCRDERAGRRRGDHRGPDLGRQGDVPESDRHRWLPAHHRGRRGPRLVVDPDRPTIRGRVDGARELTMSPAPAVSRGIVEKQRRTPHPAQRRRHAGTRRRHPVPSCSPAMHSGRTGSATAAPTRSTNYSGK